LFETTSLVVYVGVNVTKNGAVVLPHAHTLNTNGTRATITTTEFDGVLTVGQEYTISVIPHGPVSPLNMLM
jgi:hypothetical protein